MLLTPGLCRAQEAAPILIGSENLSEQIADSQSPPDIVDVRPRDAFLAGHIPGARWADASRWKARSSEEQGLTDKSYWAEQLGNLGLSPERTIVVVGDSVPNAARVWWLLRYAGMARVQLLDGGYSGWRAARLPLTTRAESVEPTQPEITFRTERLAQLTDVLPATSGQASCQILDNRSTEEYTGTRRTAGRSGHIPGASHLEWTRFLGSDGRFLDAVAIKQLLTEEGLLLDAPIATHCQSGARSSVVVFALELAEVPKVKNYYRGWAEYSAAANAPVER